MNADLRGLDQVFMGFGIGLVHMCVHTVIFHQFILLHVHVSSAVVLSFCDL